MKTRQLGNNSELNELREQLMTLQDCVSGVLEERMRSQDDVSPLNMPMRYNAIDNDQIDGMIAEYIIENNANQLQIKRLGSGQ